MLQAVLRGSFLCQVEAPDLVTETEETIRWLDMPEAWIVALLVLPLVIAFVAFFYKREKPVGNPGWRWALGGLRLLVLTLALLVLANPVRTCRRLRLGRRVPPRVQVHHDIRAGKVQSRAARRE